MTVPLHGKIGCPIYEKAKLIPETCAILSDQGPVSYAELNEIISLYSYRIREIGLKEGDRLALYLDSSVDYIALLFALFRLQVIAVSINTRFPIETIPSLLDQVNCRHLLSNEEEISRKELTHLRLEDLKQVAVKATHVPGLEIDENQPATVIFSSGSTGTPKAVLHAFGNHYYSALGSNRNIQLQKGDRWLLSLPLYHVAGIAILFRVFVAGATVVLPEDTWSIEELLASYQITHASLVATQLQQILAHHDANKEGYSALKALLVGGSAISPILRKQASKAQLPAFYSYGLSEMASQVTTTSPGADPHELESSGSLLPYREVMIDAHEEVRVKGPTLFLGYIEGKDVILPLDESGWFQTGDLGYVDTQGLLWIRGRKDNMFISGGENIYPEQIEKIIAEHPKVHNVMVVPVGDEKFGMRPVAFIATTFSGDVRTELERFLSGKLARYMYPIAYIDWSHAPQKVGIKDSRVEFAARAERFLANRH